MKAITSIMILFFATINIAQQIGLPAPEKPPIAFPSNSWGADVMFGEGGFGLGTFLRKDFSKNFTGTIDFSISETKDEREIEYYDPYFGTTFTPDKVNRAFLMPVNVGIQYRLFDEVLTENLRPYVMAGTGPTFVVTTPYEKEFFNSFGNAKIHYAAGGYIGFGANFGLSSSNLMGINVRYHYTKVFGDGIENLTGQFRKSFGQFYLSLNIGMMY